MLKNWRKIGIAAKYTDAEAIAAAKTVKLDDLTAPDDTTDLNASTTKHGLLLKLNNVVTNFLNGQGGWSVPTAGAHKDSHDPNDGGDALDTASPSELAGVQAAGVGTSHSLARADHAHQIQHGIANNHLVTVDQADAAAGEYAKFTASGLESKSKAEQLSDLNVADGADVTGSNAPQAHKDSHDPQDGSDPLDAAAPVKVGSANAEGSSHSFARADHVHEREHAKYLNSEAVAAVNAAGIALADGKLVKLEETLGTNLTASGIYCDGVAGCTVAIGDLIYLASADNRWELTDADAEATAKGMLGIALSAGGDGDAITVLLIGFVRCDASYAFGTGGAPLYISCTPGDMTETAPSGTGDIVRVVGYAHDDADTIYFNPSSTYVEVA